MLENLNFKEITAPDYAIFRCLICSEVFQFQPTATFQAIKNERAMHQCRKVA